MSTDRLAPAAEWTAVHYRPILHLIERGQKVREVRGPLDSRPLIPVLRFITFDLAGSLSVDKGIWAPLLTFPACL
jgi:hypothetical protein